MAKGDGKLNVSRPMRKRSRFSTELKTNKVYDPATNSMKEPERHQKSYRAGYNQGVTDTYNAVKYAAGVGAHEKLPEGKGISVGLFNVK